MNRVYKVIWSKAKHCYVVTSEIARSVTKSASSARSAGRKGAAVLAMAALLFTAGGVLGEAANVTKIAVNEPGNVITATKDDGNTDTITINNVDNAAHAKEADYATAATKATSDGRGEVIHETYARKADVEKDYVKKTDGNIVTTGDIVTTGNLTAHGIVATENISGKAITGTSLNTQGGDINGGAISGTTIAGTTGSFANEVSAGSVKVTNKLEAGSIEATGHLKGNSLEVTNNASVGTLAAAGNNFTVDASGNVVAAGVNAGAGTIKTTGAVETGALHATRNATVDGNTEIKGTLKAGATTVDSLDAGSGLIKTDGTVKAGDVQTGTLTTTGNVTIGGALTVTGKLNMDEIDMNKNGIVGDDKVDANTKVAAGEIRSYKKAISQTDGSEKESAINYNENGTSTWAKATDADGKWNKSTLTVEGKGIKSIATDTDGKNKASTNLSNNGFNTFASDGTNKTYTKQTAVDIKNTAKNGMISNTAKNLVNTASENMTNTVGKNLTTTVGGDSSLTAENITNEAKNKITNKALDVETDAASSIVSKVSNDYGSNTSTQLSHQTMEEMKAEGKTASYLRGAAEEKSQLTDGDKKTTIDTVAGQTNTNITEGKNVSNSLQEANQIASSVTDGTNTTVMNQDAKSLASSITDGTGKVNNTNNTVDKSEQLIKVDDTHFYAETRTAGSAVEALKSDGNTIISAKDAVTGTVSSAVTDGATITGISQNAKDISLSAAGGTITNDANDVLNKGANSVINKVGDNKVAVKTDRVKVAYGSDTYTTWNDKGITSKTGGNMSNSATNITNKADEKLSNSAADIENKASSSIWNHVGEGYNTSWKMTYGKISESIVNGTASNKENTTAEGTKRIITSEEGIGTYNQTATSNNISLKNAAKDTSFTKSESLKGEKTSVTNPNGSSTINQSAESIVNFVKNTEGHATKTEQSAKDITNTAKNGTITNDAKIVKTITGKNKVISDNGGTTFENEAHSTAVKDGTVKKTTISGNTIETGQATMDYADVTKDLSVGHNATVENDLTVKGASEFVGRADFRYDVYVDNNLTVAKETRTDTLYVDHDGYVGGNLNVDGNIETHDAVLSADSRQVVTGRQLYQTNERVDRLDNRIKKVGANAAALAALRPGDFNPDDKFSIAAGFGSYRNANAAALGLFYRPNENVLLSLGTSFGDGENMVNAGVSVKFGRGKSMAERRKEMADEVSSMRDEMRSQDERIAELEEMLKKQSELIEKLSKES